MINHKKWISSLPKINKEISKTINQLDHENSINSIPKKYHIIHIANQYRMPAE